MYVRSSCIAKHRPRLGGASLLAFGLAVAAVTASAQGTAEEGEGNEPLALPELRVTASADASAEGLSRTYAGGQVAAGGRLGLFGSRDYMATPFAITAYTQELIANQQAASVGEVLLNDPAVRVARGFGNFQQLYLVRGLPVYSDDMAYNGLYGLLPRQYLAAELVERVEVLRGANAFLNGAAPSGSSLGGAVNVMPKRAPSTPLLEVTAGLQSGGQGYGAVDWGRRFAEDQFGLRVVGARRDGDTAIDGESMELGLIAVGADWRRDQFRVSADVGYQDLQRDATQPSITIGAGLAIPRAPRADRSVGQAWTYSDERDTFGTLRAEWDLTDALTVWVAGGARRGDEANVLANPTVVDAAGTTSTYRFDNVREETVSTGEVGLRGQFETGAVGHRLSVAATTYDQDSKNAYAFSDFSGFANNLYAPTAVTAPAPDFFVGGSMADPLVTAQVRTSSLALADVITLLDDRLVLLGGVRRQRIESFSYDYNTGAEQSAYRKSATTPSIGILYRLTPRLAIYANSIEGLTQGDVAPASSGGVPIVNAGEVLSPYVTEQWEAGLKFDLGRFGGAFSLFESEKPVAGVGSDGVFGVLDQQRNRGVELSFHGEPLPGLRLLGGLSLLDTDLGGAESIGAPDTQLNLGAEWVVPRLAGLTLDGRVIHTSEQYADAMNTQRVPAWERLDLGVRQELVLGGRPVTLRARVENVLDDDYWASAGGYPGAGYLTVGAPRTWLLSATVNF